MPRFFIENMDREPGESLCVTGQDATHISKSLRMRAGEKLTVCGGLGYDLLCEITGVFDDRVELTVTEKTFTQSEPSVAVTLYQGLPKGDKLELIIEKTIELGVRRIVPVLMQRSVSRPDLKSAAKKHERYRKQAVSAAKQCGRGVIPEVGEMLTFRQMTEQLKRHQAVLFFYECGGEPFSSVMEKIKTEGWSELAMVIGPEGGFDPAEADALREAGAFTATLGKRILRTETAPIAALAAIMYATGNMD
jgi:RNA methyltransferase, RsmE family